MTDLPYTDADLRAEAAKQHATATEDPDFCGIGEQMEGSKIESADDLQWDQLDEDQFDTAMRKIDELRNGAADTSAWAISLGADGLEPAEHSITVKGDERPIARIHFAFEPGMPDEMRAALVEGIGESIAAHL